MLNKNAAKLKQKIINMHIYIYRQHKGQVNTKDSVLPVLGTT